MIVDKKELLFIKMNRPQGFIKRLTEDINSKYKLEHTNQSISRFLLKTSGKGSVIQVPDHVINEAHSLLKELTGKTFKK